MWQIAQDTLLKQFLGTKPQKPMFEDSKMVRLKFAVVFPV